MQERGNFVINILLKDDCSFSNDEIIRKWNEQKKEIIDQKDQVK